MFCIQCGHYLGNSPPGSCPACKAPQTPAQQPAQPAPDTQYYPEGYDWFTGEPLQPQPPPPAPQAPPRPLTPEEMQGVNEWLQQPDNPDKGYKYPVDYPAHSYWKQAPPAPQAPLRPLTPEEMQGVNEWLQQPDNPDKGYKYPVDYPAHSYWKQAQPPSQPQPQPPPGNHLPPAQPYSANIPPAQPHSANVPPAGNSSRYLPHTQRQSAHVPPVQPQRKSRGKVIAIIAVSVALLTALGFGGSVLVQSLQKANDAGMAGSQPTGSGAPATGQTGGTAGGGGRTEESFSYHLAGGPNSVFTTVYQGNTYFMSDGDSYVMDSSGTYSGRTRYEERLFDYTRAGDTVYCLTTAGGYSGTLYLATIHLPDLTLTVTDIAADVICPDRGKIYVVQDNVLCEVNTASNSLTGQTWDLSRASAGNAYSKSYLVWNGVLFLSYPDSSYTYHHERMDLATGSTQDNAFGHAVWCADADALYYVDEDTYDIMRVPGGTGTPEPVYKSPADSTGISRMFLDGEYIYFTPYAGVSEPPDMEDCVYRVNTRTKELQGIPIPQGGLDFTVFDGWIGFNYDVYHIAGDGINGVTLIGYDSAEWRDEDLPFLYLS